VLLPHVGKLTICLSSETDFHIFVRGVDKYLGGAAASFGWGVVATPGKANGKSLTKFVF
jgi:hypothetical protein